MAATTPSSAAVSSSSLLLETIGIEINFYIFGYLHPVDLVSLNLTCHQLRERIATNLIKILSIQQYHQQQQKILPIQLGVDTNYLVELLLLFNDHYERLLPTTSSSQYTTTTSFFHSKGELVNHVVNRLHNSQLLLVDTTSIHDSEEKAKQWLIHQNKSSAMFYDASSTNNQNRNGNTATNHDNGGTNNNNGPQKIMAECHFQSHANPESATAWINYILNRDACKRYGTDRIQNRYIRDWLMCILSSLQQQPQQPTLSSNNHNRNNNNNIQIWRWGCKHSNLSGKGVSGVGVMIRSSSSAAVADQKVELRLTRLY
jgi:hypothetical protein